jgi:hypothetical protein
VIFYRQLTPRNHTDCDPKEILYAIGRLKRFSGFIDQLVPRILKLSTERDYESLSYMLEKYPKKLGFHMSMFKGLCDKSNIDHRKIKAMWFIFSQPGDLSKQKKPKVPEWLPLLMDFIDFASKQKDENQNKINSELDGLLFLITNEENTISFDSYIPIIARRITEHKRNTDRWWDFLK